MRSILLILVCLLPFISYPQKVKLKEQKNSGLFSLGMRSTVSTFGHNEHGIGVGGQFRLQFHPKVNTEWFADYIKTPANQNTSRTDAHIGWSVMYYPLRQTGYDQLLKPYIAIGHCFDYSKINVFSNVPASDSRWSAAVQGGVGCHVNLTPNFDITVLSQYMVHLGDELAVETENVKGKTADHRHATPEGHVLFTMGVNYKFGEIW